MGDTGRCALQVATTGGSAVRDAGGLASVAHCHWRQCRTADVQETLEEVPVQLTATGSSAEQDVGGLASASHYHWRQCGAAVQDTGKPAVQIAATGGSAGRRWRTCQRGSLPLDAVVSCSAGDARRIASAACHHCMQWVAAV